MEPFMPGCLGESTLSQMGNGWYKPFFLDLIASLLNLLRHSTAICGQYRGAAVKHLFLFLNKGDVTFCNLELLTDNLPPYLSARANGIEGSVYFRLCCLA